jgi:hypothetical protein
VLDVAVAELLMVEPAGTVGATLTTSVKMALPTAKEGFVQFTVPTSPGSGSVHPHPLTELNETKVVPAGSVSVHEAFVAVFGPLLVTVME